MSLFHHDSPVSAQAAVLIHPSTLTLGPSKPNGFVSLLDTIGRDFKKVVDFALPAAVAAGPIIMAADPALGAAYAAAVAIIAPVVGLVEQKFAAMGQQSGTSMEKLASVVQAVFPGVQNALLAFGVKADLPIINQLVNAVVGFLNSLPALHSAEAAQTEELAAQEPVAAVVAETPVAPAVPVAAVAVPQQPSPAPAQ